MTDLFFCPERWEPDPMISTNAAQLIQVRGYSGRTADAWQIGDWGSSWTAITSKIHMEAGWLESGGEYRFCFWLNGGENSRGNEVCTLEIFGDDWEERLRFRLNRSYTHPLLEKNGWLLFAVPFTAPESTSALTFRFVAAGAVCTVAGIPDMDMSVYDTLSSDPHDDSHPQRYNIVFPTGYPEPPEEKVVLKAHGHELELPKKAVRFAAAAAAAGFLTWVTCRAIRRKRNK